MNFRRIKNFKRNREGDAVIIAEILFTIWQGPTNEVCKELNIPKRNEVFVGYSRDGFHWHRPSRTPSAL